MRRTRLSARTSVVLSAGAMTLHQDGFEGIGEGTVTLNHEAARALLPMLVKFASGASTGVKTRSRPDDALAQSPSAKRDMREAAKYKPKASGRR